MNNGEVPYEVLMERFCEKYGWTTDEFENTDWEIIESFAYIAQVDSEKQKLEQRRNERQKGKYHR